MRSATYRASASTCASPARIRRSITCRARSTCRCSTTPSARASARCTRRCRRSTPASSAPRSSRATSRASSRRYAHDKPRDWTPLVYCWRGGQRSRALAHVLKRDRLAGACSSTAAIARTAGTSWRRSPTLPQRFAIASSAGSPARASAAARRRWRTEGAQVLDLEATGAAPRLAARRPAGRSAAVAESVRERAVRPRSATFDPARPGVRRIGKPQDRHAAGARRAARRDARARRASRSTRRCRCASRCSRTSTRTSCRDPTRLPRGSSRSSPLHGKKTLERWHDAARARRLRHARSPSSSRALRSDVRALDRAQFPAPSHSRARRPRPPTFATPRFAGAARATCSRRARERVTGTA